MSFLELKCKQQRELATIQLVAIELSDSVYV